MLSILKHLDLDISLIGQTDVTSRPCTILPATFTKNHLPRQIFLNTLTEMIQVCLS